MNLLGNALKFTKDGKVEVIAQLKKKGKDHVMLYFEVSDSGIGISEEQQKTIFESFEQGSVQINREYGGTGLGLTIVKSLLGLFGSRIELESELGVGSSFYFDLKVNCEENAITEEEAQVQPEDEFDFTWSARIDRGRQQNQPGDHQKNAHQEGNDLRHREQRERSH